MDNHHAYYVNDVRVLCNMLGEDILHHLPPHQSSIQLSMSGSVKIKVKEEYAGS
jgi:hypothetical protein